MKRTTAIWLAALALTAVFTGCGRVRTSLTDPIAETSGEARMNYRHMLANAHVHDRDGFLFDGENAHYDTLS